MNRIAIVNDVAGVGTLQTRNLNAEGYSAAFIDLPKPGASLPWYAKVFVMPMRLARYVPIIRHLRRSDYDLVHIHFVSQGFIGPLTGKPYVLHGHGHDLHTNMRNPFLNWLTRYAMKRAKAIFYVTPDLAKFIPAEFADKAFLLPNPLEPAFFQNVTPPTELRKVFLFTRLYPIKAPQEIFAVARRLATLVDISAISWGPMARQLHDEYGDCVHFLERIPHDEVPALIDGFDAVIGQMKLGILSLSELEAMARGRLVFMRLDRALYPDDPPPVVDVRDGDELVDAVRRIQADPREMRRISEAGRDWVARHHGLEGYFKILRRGYGAPEPAAMPLPGEAPAAPLPTLVSGDVQQV